MAALRRSAKIGQISLIIITILSALFQIFPDLIGKDNPESLGHILIVLGIGFILFVAITAAVWTTMFWVTRAHHAICSLRGITPRISSKVIGFLSGIPYILFFAPLCYAVDFLVVRSESPDKPTMRWYSAFSKSLIVNVFAVFIIIDSSCVIASLIIEFKEGPQSDPFTNVVDWVGIVALTVAVTLGIKIAKDVNQNIEKLCSPPIELTA